MKNTILLLTALILFGIGPLTAQPVSKQEALQFAHKLETTTNNGDPYMLNHVFDLDKMLQIITAKSKIMSENEGFVEGFRGGFSGSMQGYGNKILITIENGNYRLLRVYEKAGEKATSLACYEKAYQSDPEIVVNTEALLMAYGEAKENDKAKNVIAEYKKSRTFKQETLDKIYKSYPALK